MIGSSTKIHHWKGKDKECEHKNYTENRCLDCGKEGFIERSKSHPTKWDDWEKEFDEEFAKPFTTEYVAGAVKNTTHWVGKLDVFGRIEPHKSEEVKSFISNLLSQTRREERERVLMEIEDILKSHHGTDTDDCYLYKELKKLKKRLKR